MPERLGCNTCQMKGNANIPELAVEAHANALQTRAFELLPWVQYDAPAK